jgi:hypothetical protein
MVFFKDDSMHGYRPVARTLRRSIERVGGVCVMVVAVCGSARAGELDLRSTDLPPIQLDRSALSVSTRLPGAPLVAAPRLDAAARVQPDTRGFYRGYVLPRMNTQLDRLRVYGAMPTSGQALSEFVFLDQVTDAAQQRAEKGVRRAVKYYLLETTSVGRWIQSFGTESAQTPTGAPRTQRAFRTGLGIAHGLPRAEMRYGVGRSVLRLAVGADQTVGFEFRRNGHSAGTAVSARYDWDEDTVSMGWRISF